MQPVEEHRCTTRHRGSPGGMLGEVLYEMFFFNKRGPKIMMKLDQVYLAKVRYSDYAHYARP